jgi:hypothetical protein
MKPSAMRKGVLLSSQQHLIPVVKDGSKVDVVSLSQVNGDSAVITKVCVDVMSAN